jgi:hypothetical protein
MTKPYKPKGVVLNLLSAMRAEPEREFTATECAEIMGCIPRAVGAFVEYSLKFGLIAKRKENRKCFFRAAPYTDEAVPKLRTPTNQLKLRPPGPWTPDLDDPRIPRMVEGWKPPVMRCVRAGE